ncbi:C45 family autoproteolytic acyltransferase/hydolase [Paraliobacillus zengyii]|uniref:C45 family autoproteolytic acyltransferase/hydolase n=1 Tax=Paraliobacillus zengyii TaxID=2213194 RepID=UPI000DD45A4A|nr:C45 family peptidase [Paraliobacillus zengyii]
MKQIYSDMIEFRGSHYDFGLIQAKELKDSLYIKNRLKQWKTRKPRFSIDIEEAKTAIKSISPKIWFELEGLRDGLEWPIEKVLHEFGGYRLDYERSGCSVMTGDGYLVRNYDYHPKTYDGRFVFYQPVDKGYATMGASQRITGRSDGINEKGLVMGYNFMHRKKPGEGFICGMIGRFVLETCATALEAIALLKKIPHRHSFSYILYDKIGKTYVVEATPRNVFVRESTICTNHFKTMEEENRHYLVDSKRREMILAKEADSGLSAKQAFQLLNGRQRGIFSDEYRNWAGTIHTTAYFPNDLKVWIALGADQDPTEVDFEKWLQGIVLSINHVTGEVDTAIPFAHMDEGAHWQHKKNEPD